MGQVWAVANSGANALLKFEAADAIFFGERPTQNIYIYIYIGMFAMFVMFVVFVMFVMFAMFVLYCIVLYCIVLYCLQERPIFHWKIYGFQFRFSLKPIH